MTLVVEDGTGIYEANSYAGLSYAQAYLSRRNRATSWNAASIIAQEAALIAATDYIDKRFGAKFLGAKQFQTVEAAARNFLKVILQPVAADTLTIGLATYTFVSVAGGPLDVLIGATIPDTITALVAAISTNADVSASVIGTNSVEVRRLLVGEQPTILTTSSATSRVSWDYGMLIGGSDSTEQVLEWPRYDVYTRSGNAVIGIPDKLRQATVEYASRALASGLMPDPLTSETGQDITRKFEKVGPIEDETVYSAQVKEIFKKYPEADKLLTEFISGTGGVIR